MRQSLVIENIEEMRRREGIDDFKLREEIRALRVGDLIKLTLVNDAKGFETLEVRITSIKGKIFRGKLASQPVSGNLSELRAGSIVTFTADHIHSIPKRGH